jgi:hypothetical protein
MLGRLRRLSMALLAISCSSQPSCTRSASWEISVSEVHRFRTAVAIPPGAGDQFPIAGIVRRSAQRDGTAMVQVRVVSNRARAR